MSVSRWLMNKILLVVSMFSLSMVFVLLFALDAQHTRLKSKDESLHSTAQEIRWQRFRADRAEGRIAEYQELQFIAQTLATNNATMYAAAKSAWKWGAVYGVSPHLIMAVAHRESNFDPSARSYNQDGSELAYGLMQINYRVWKDELRLDLGRLDDVDYNVQQGTIILKHYLDKSPGDIGQALFAYWGGEFGGGRYTYPPRVLESKFFNTDGMIR